MFPHCAVADFVCPVEVFRTVEPPCPNQVPSGRGGLGSTSAEDHAADGPASAAIERDIALAHHLEALSCDEVWHGEHHSGG